MNLGKHVPNFEIILKYVLLSCLLNEGRTKDKPQKFMSKLPSVTLVSIQRSRKVMPSRKRSKPVEYIKVRK